MNKKILIIILSIMIKMIYADSTVIDYIAAYVNNNIITSLQLQQQIAQTIYNMKSQGFKAPSIKEITPNVLEQMIIQQIELELATKNGISASDLEINDAISSILQTKNLTENELNQNLLVQHNNYANFRNQIKEQIIIQKLKQSEIDSKVSINEDEINRIINSVAFKQQIDYNLSYIALTVSNEENNSSQMTIAKQIIDQLDHGADFAQLAIKYSNAPNALSGGMIGWKTNTSLPPAILNQIVSLKIQQHSAIIKLPIGLLIFKINDIKKHGMSQLITQYQVSHILIKVNEHTTDKAAYQKILQIRDALQIYKNNLDLSESAFANSAQQYSQDSSNINGGSLGWLNVGDTVPQFEAVMKKLKVGEISPAIRSPFGWHLIELTGIRTSNQSSQFERNQIRAELRELKINELYTEWLKNLRNSAYVKINTLP